MRKITRFLSATTILTAMSTLMLSLPRKLIGSPGAVFLPPSFPSWDSLKRQTWFPSVPAKSLGEEENGPAFLCNVCGFQIIRPA